MTPTDPTPTDSTPTDPTAGTPSAGDRLAAFGRSIAAHDWAGLRGVLADDAVVTYLHTGERFAPDPFVALVRDYPGDWTFNVDEIVDGGSRGVLHSRTVVGTQTWHCATFASLDPRDPARLTDLVEVWTEPVASHPERSST